VLRWRSADRGNFGREMFRLYEIIGSLSHICPLLSILPHPSSELTSFPSLSFSAAPDIFAILLRLWRSSSPVRHGLVESSGERWRLHSGSLFAGTLVALDGGVLS
jgi:hypothetical protein